jgi:poly(3-hydroxybutyrate) depolymerase
VLDLPAEYYLDTSRRCSRTFALPKGRMFVRGELVRPQAIRDTALLTVEGELDDISGNGQTEAAHALCLNIPRERRSHFMAPASATTAFSRPALARDDLSAGARLHPRASPHSS